MTQEKVIKELSKNIDKDKNYDSQLFIKINKAFKEIDGEIAIDNMIY